MKFKKMIVFGIGSDYFCVEIETLERILENEYIQFVPNAPNIIEGVVHNEEKIIPIINLKKKFQMNIPKNPNEDLYIIIFKQKEFFLGFCTDFLYETLETEENIKEENSYIPDNILPYSKGTLTFEKDNEKEIVIVLDLNKITI